MAARTDSFFIRPRRRGLGIDMAPLIDIVFLLLIFFMLNTTFSNPAIPLSMPQGSTEQGEVHESEVVVVSFDAEGKIFINRDEVAWGDYKAKLSETMDEMGLKSVHFKGDESLSYKRFTQIFDASRAAGVVQFNMVRRAKPADETPTDTP
jgi:biopolymer transport protein ExbD